MKLTFLGTGTSMGVPVIACPCPVCHSTDKRDQRLRTSALLTTDDGHNMLFDIGPDFRTQMLANNVQHLDAIFITHPHRDHVGGIDDIRAFNYMQQAPMQLFCNEYAAHALHRDYAYIFLPHPYEGLPEVAMHTLSGNEPFTAAGHTVVPLKAWHKDMPVLGYRVGGLVYITDANHIEDDQLQKAMGCHTLVINALRQTKHPSHFSLTEALQVIAHISPHEAYITHVSHEMGFCAEVEKLLPANVHFAFDNLAVTIP